jgi:rhodanese-related sulfurtransferase
MSGEPTASRVVGSPRFTFTQDAFAVLTMLVIAAIAGVLLVQHRRTTRPHHPRVSLVEMQMHVTQRSALIVDARDPEAFATGHLPGAVNMPLSGWKARAAELDATLRAHRDELVIVYCASEWCAEADDLQLALIDLGHRRVGVFRGGIEAWRAAELPLER